MRQVPEPERSEWIRRMRERARQDAGELVPRPPFAVSGLAAPPLSPAMLLASQKVNDEWDLITVGYGDPASPGGPFVAVTTAAGRPGAGAATEAAGQFGRDGESELLSAIDAERGRAADHAGADDAEPAGPPRYARERLTFGDALICRHGDVWAARLSGDDVTVTITGRGVDPASVRLGPVTDLRPYLAARSDMIGRLAERHRRQAPPDLAPAAGVAAFRALADYALETHARHLAAVRAKRMARQPAGWGPMWSALWQRAVREQQRVAGIDGRAADDVVTLVVNHLNHLAERAPWFADARLREAAIDETLRHAMLGDDVPSEPAQRAWARYWSRQTARQMRQPDPDPAAMLADMRAGERLEADWLAAWAAWAGRAQG